MYWIVLLLFLTSLSTLIYLQAPLIASCALSTSDRSRSSGAHKWNRWQDQDACCVFKDSLNQTVVHNNCSGLLDAHGRADNQERLRRPWELGWLNCHEQLLM